MVICEHWKGQGLAKAIQRKFVDENSKQTDVVWGTINSANLPSYKTAAANRRIPIRCESFFEIKA